jgi:transcriptional regulator with XRE-family HTH domain
MGTKYKNVLEMIKSISKDDAFKELATREIKGKTLAKFLFYLRCNHNLSQKQLAEKIGCSQSRISKIESALDKDLTMQDLLDYAKALNLNLEIGYRHPSVRIVDLIKYHAFKIKAYLNQLNSLAKEDDLLKESIGKFHIEALFNIGKIIWESLATLDFKLKEQKREPDIIHISAPLERAKLEQLLKKDNTELEHSTK